MKKLALSRPGSQAPVTDDKQLPCKVKMNTGQLMMWSTEDPDGEF